MQHAQNNFEMGRRQFLSRLGSFAFATALAPAFVGCSEDNHLEKIVGNYGRVIYQRNPDAPTQVYILGMQHQSLDEMGKKSTDEKALLSQLAVYRIGQRLISSKDLNLILEEGAPYTPEAAKTDPSLTLERAFDQTHGKDARKALGKMDDKAMLEVLGKPMKYQDDRAVVHDLGYPNGEVLLKINYSTVEVNGVDDQESSEAQIMLQKAARARPELVGSKDFWKVFNHLTDNRSVAMLENVSTYFKGRNSLMPVGLLHLSAMIKFVETGSVNIPGFTAEIDGKKFPFAPIVSKLRAENGLGYNFIVPNIFDSEDLKKMDLGRFAR